jgi:hypothetical protein
LADAAAAENRTIEVKQATYALKFDIEMIAPAPSSSSSWPSRSPQPRK